MIVIDDINDNNDDINIDNWLIGNDNINVW